MGLLLFLGLSPVCLIVIRRRRRSGMPFVLPLAAMVLLAAAAARFVVCVVRLAPMLRLASDPSAKAIVLARAISMVMNDIALTVVVGVPLAVAGLFVDRWLVERWRRMGG